MMAIVSPYVGIPDRHPWTQACRIIHKRASQAAPSISTMALASTCMPTNASMSRVSIARVALRKTGASKEQAGNQYC
jgi:hypothetical protein